MDAIATLQQTERECLSRFRQKAAQLRAADPRLSASIAFSKAIQQLPNTCERFQAVRRQLEMAGVAPLPLR